MRRWSPAGQSATTDQPGRVDLNGQIKLAVQCYMPHKLGDSKYILASSQYNPIYSRIITSHISHIRSLEGFVVTRSRVFMYTDNINA